MSRNTCFTLVWFSVLALCTACGGGGGNTAGGGNPTPSPQGCATLPASTLPTDSLGGIVDAAVATEMKAQGMPGMTVAISKKGMILYAQGYGYADLSTCQPMQATAEMQIASVTKQFTEVA